MTTLLKTKSTLPLEIFTKLCTLASVLPQTAITSSVSTAYFAVSAPLVIRVLISSSWPYRAAICKGVFPFLSSQSITAPMIKDIVSDTLDYIEIGQHCEMQRNKMMLKYKLMDIAILINFI